MRPGVTPPLTPPEGGAVLAAGRARGAGIRLPRTDSVEVNLTASRVRKPGFARP